MPFSRISASLMPRKSIQTCEYLVSEERREEEVLLPLESAPAGGLQIFTPGTGIDRMGGGAQGEDEDDHRLVVAAPVVGVGNPPRASSPC